MKIIYDWLHTKYHRNFPFKEFVKILSSILLSGLVLIIFITENAHSIVVVEIGGVTN